MREGKRGLQGHFRETKETARVEGAKSKMSQLSANRLELEVQNMGVWGSPGLRNMDLKHGWNWRIAAL